MDTPSSRGGEPSFVIRYRFTDPDGGDVEYAVEVDPETMELRAPLPDDPPDWTRLEHAKCPHCPLDPDAHPRCPAALALAPLADAFDPFMSYDRCELHVSTPGREVARGDVSVQQGLGALMGLVLATSGCPYTARFRPMARFHLPLASPEETIYRATSTYLLAQYLRARAGLDADTEMQELGDFYEDIRIVNAGMAERLEPVVATDSSLNAVVTLNNFTFFLPMAVRKGLVELRPYFASWLEDVH